MSEFPSPSSEHQQNHESIEQKWNQLSEVGQDAVLTLMTGDPSTGMARDFLEGMGVADAIDEVIASGLVITRDRLEIAKEYIQTHQESMNAFLDKGVLQPTADEHRALSRFNSESNIVRAGVSSLRYLLADGVKDFISSH